MRWRMMPEERLATEAILWALSIPKKWSRLIKRTLYTMWGIRRCLERRGRGQWARNRWEEWIQSEWGHIKVLSSRFSTVWRCERRKSSKEGDSKVWRSMGKSLIKSLYRIFHAQPLFRSRKRRNQQQEWISLQTPRPTQSFHQHKETSEFSQT